MKFLKSPLRSLIESQLVCSILPPRCPVSGDIVDQDAMISPHAWSQLQFITQPQCSSCGLPMPFDDGLLTDDHGVCLGCHAHPPFYDQARAPLIYNDPTRKIILSFKHGDQLQYARVMAQFMARLVDTGLDYKYIAPVPLHTRKLIQRRFNQSAVLAQKIANLTGISYCGDLLVRKRATPPQKDKNAKQRQQNVKNAFDVHPKKQGLVKDSRILVIDDVFTTGATVNECAKALKKYKANYVDILTFARTVRHH